MGNPYTAVSVTGYNTNPPADDGSQVASNEIDWSTIKEKLNDPVKTALESVNTNVGTAIGKIVGGAGVSSTAVDYQVQGTDQGKLVRATASGVTITTPDATSVLSPFVFGVLNNSSGTITLDGSGSQTIDGNATITLPASGGTLLFTDGTNWFTTGIQGTFVGKQLGYGDIINGTIAESNGSNATTYALKTLAGNDPSATDPVLVCFRNGTIGTGNYVYRTVTASTTIVLSSGSTAGATNGVAFTLALVLFDDAGTVRLGVMNVVSGNNTYDIEQFPIASSTAEGGAGAADSAQVFYTTTAVASKAYVPLGYAYYTSGLVTAGSWNASPTRIQLAGPGVHQPRVPAFSSSYTSTDQTITSAGSLSLTHSLGGKPKNVTLWLKNTSSEGNYSVNDEVLVATENTVAGVGNHSISIVRTATTIDIRFGSDANVFTLTNKTTGATFAATNNKWALIVEAQA